MDTQNCLFCKIAEGREPAKIVWENDDFMAIVNKYPMAPVHLLVIPRAHVSKKAELVETNKELWGEMMTVVFTVIKNQGLDRGGYKLVNNGAGYNHFDHEHIHVLGGSREEPAGRT